MGNVTESGSSIAINREEFDGIMVTHTLSKNPELKKKIIDGKDTLLTECVPEDEIIW